MPKILSMKKILLLSTIGLFFTTSSFALPQVHKHYKHRKHHKHMMKHGSGRGKMIQHDRNK
jgi:hypothetical protein